MKTGKKIEVRFTESAAFMIAPQQGIDEIVETQETPEALAV